MKDITWSFSLDSCVSGEDTALGSGKEDHPGKATSARETGEKVTVKSLTGTRLRERPYLGLFRAPD